MGYLQQHRAFRIFWEGFKGFTGAGEDVMDEDAAEAAAAAAGASKGGQSATEEGKTDGGNDSEHDVVAKAVSSLTWLKMNLDDGSSESEATYNVFDALDSGPLPVPVIPAAARPHIG